MFELFQKKLLNKVMGKEPAKRKKALSKNKKKTAEAPQGEDFRTASGQALDQAIEKLENSGTKMDDLLSANEDLLAQAKAEASKNMTPERRALIESALKIRKQKEVILKDLDDETRARLYLTAMRAFMGKK